MAIFYKEIKGCGVSTTDQTNSTTDLWTYLIWSDTADKFNEETIGFPINANFRYAPTIQVAASQSGTKYSLGKIITQSATNQHILYDFTFYSNLICDGQILANSNICLTGTDGKIYFQNTNDVNAMASLARTTEVFEIQNKANSSTYGTIRLSGSLIQFAQGFVHVKQNGLYVGGETATSVEDGVIKATNKCEALYFNATSDRRAKTDIKNLQTSVLEFVNNTSIYTFRYLTNPSEISLGVIAQDLNAQTIDGFNLVDNIEASGIGLDLMQVKESKLVYVLWKAIQELSAEVKNLQAQIKGK